MVRQGWRSCLARLPRYSASNSSEEPGKRISWRCKNGEANVSKQPANSLGSTYKKKSSLTLRYEGEDYVTYLLRQQNKFLISRHLLQTSQRQSGVHTPLHKKKIECTKSFMCKFL